MHVACPETQLIICALIDKKWSAIDALFGKSNLSLADLTYSAPLDVVEWRHYDERVVREERHKRAAGHHSTLKTDISSYYPSIYTHAIAWSILGKLESKKPKNKSNWANMLDAAVRHSQDRKSAGLPAGLLSSHIVAELLGCAVDRDLVTKHKVVGSRQIDDFMLHFSDEVAAATLRSTLQSVLAYYNLHVNEAKTKVEHGPHFLIPEWVDALEAITTEPVKPAGRMHDMAQTFASRVYRVKHKNKLAPVYKKGLPKMSIFLANNPVPEVANTVSHLALNAIQAEPDASKEVLAVLETLDTLQHPVDPKLLATVLNATLRQVLPAHHTGEATHLLWIGRKRGITIDEEHWSLATKNPNVLVAVQLLELAEAGLMEGDTAARRRALVAAVRRLDDDQDMWLLDFEILRRGWKHVAAPALTKPLEEMRASGVTFLTTPP